MLKKIKDRNKDKRGIFSHDCQFLLLKKEIRGLGPRVGLRDIAWVNLILEFIEFLRIQSKVKMVSLFISISVHMKKTKTTNRGQQGKYSWH